MSRAPSVSENRIRPVVLLLVAYICGAFAPAHAQDAAGALAGTFKAYAAEGVEARVSNFSGLPVPRYSSLKYGDVNGRAGPSTDYPVAWSYHRLGLPVVIVRESQEWRKIRDPQGDEVWVHRRVLAGERTAITTEDGSIRLKPSKSARPAAHYAAGAVVKFASCEGAWCRVEAEGRKGWAPRTELWGADDLRAAP